MPTIPGLNTLTDKVPEMLTLNGFVRLVGTIIGILAIVLFALVWLDGSMPFIALVLQIAVYVALYFLLRSFFRGREERLDYTEAFFNRYLISVALNVATVLYILLTKGGVVGGADKLVPGIVGWPIALYLLASAVLLFIRGVRTAGIDTLSGVYIYYPDEGRQVEEAVYDVVRHPVYAAIDRIAVAFGLINGTPLSLLLAVLFVAVWHPAWCRLEERDLVSRFGDAYRGYMDRVPAVMPSSIRAEIALWQALMRRAA